MYNIYFKYCAGLQCCFVLAEISMDAESVISNSVKTVYYICLICLHVCSPMHVRDVREVSDVEVVNM